MLAFFFLLGWWWWRGAKLISTLNQRVTYLRHVHIDESSETKRNVRTDSVICYVVYNHHRPQIFCLGVIFIFVIRVWHIIGWAVKSWCEDICWPRSKHSMFQLRFSHVIHRYFSCYFANFNRLVNENSGHVRCRYLFYVWQEEKEGGVDWGGGRMAAAVGRTKL